MPIEKRSGNRKSKSARGRRSAAKKRGASRKSFLRKAEDTGVQAMNSAKEVGQELVTSLKTALAPMPKRRKRAQRVSTAGRARKKIGAARAGRKRSATARQKPSRRAA